MAAGGVPSGAGTFAMTAGPPGIVPEAGWFDSIRVQRPQARQQVLLSGAVGLRWVGLSSLARFARSPKSGSWRILAK